MVAKEIAVNIFDKQDIIDRFVLREGHKSVTIAAIRKLKVMGIENGKENNT